MSDPRMNQASAAKEPPFTEQHLSRLVDLNHRLLNAVDRLESLNGRLFAEPVAVEPRGGKDGPQPTGALAQIEYNMDRQRALIERLESASYRLDGLA